MILKHILTTVLFSVFYCNALLTSSLNPTRFPRNSLLRRNSQSTSDIIPPQVPERRYEAMPLTVLATVGALEMCYLTYSKLLDIPTYCLQQAAENCNAILTGPFSVIPFTSIPLTLIGLISYSTILIVSSQDTLPGLESAKKDALTLMLTTSMATFSLYLMFVLHFILQASCPYCYLSAALSISMAAYAWTKRVVPNKTTAFVVSSTSFAVTAFASALIFYFTATVMATDAAMASTAPAAQYLAAEAEKSEVKSPPPITKSSSKRALELANRIEKLDGKMYGAYWCSHCYNQKQEFGKEAFEKIPYLECDKKGANSKSAICRAQKIPGYPTWELAGKLFPGEKSMQELEQLVSEVEKGQ